MSLAAFLFATLGCSTPAPEPTSEPEPEPPPALAGALQREGSGSTCPDPEACLVAALERRESTGTDAEARDWLRVACAADLAAACDSLGASLSRAGGDHEQVDALYAHACDLGSAGGCANLAVRVLATDSSRAVELLQGACGPEAPIACENLGTLYANGEHVPLDDQRAIALYRQACADDVEPECRQIANRLLQGRGVPQDLARGEALLERACFEWATELACDDLADHLTDQLGPGDASTLRAREKGCRLGSAFACSSLGFQVLEQGDVARARPLLEQGCAGGRAQACGGLGQLVERDGDVEGARRAFQRGCALDLPAACKDAQRLAR